MILILDNYFWRSKGFVNNQTIYAGLFLARDCWLVRSLGDRSSLACIGTSEAAARLSRSISVYCLTVGGSEVLLRHGKTTKGQVRNIQYESISGTQHYKYIPLFV